MIASGELSGKPVGRGDALTYQVTDLTDLGLTAIGLLPERGLPLRAMR